MSGWAPLHVHSHFSLLDGLSKPEQIAERVVQCGHPGVALTDHGSVSGCPALLRALKAACTCGHPKRAHHGDACARAGCPCRGFTPAAVRGVLGCEFYVPEKDALQKDAHNRKTPHLCVLARSRAGWQNLMRAVTESGKKDFFYYKPRLDLPRLASFAGGQWVVFAGHPGSTLCDFLFADPRAAYRAGSYDEAKALVRDDWREAVPREVGRYQELFGRENFFVEAQLIDAKNVPAAAVAANLLRWAAGRAGAPVLATPDAHYPRQEDARDQRVLLCSPLETTLKEVQKKLAAGEDATLGGFFKSKRYHIPTLEEVEGLHPPEELAASLRALEMCEDYGVLGDPMLPDFPCPHGRTPDEHLRELCREGWRKKVLPRSRGGEVFCPPTGQTFPAGDYADRVKEELAVLTKAGLSPYFLIVEDYVSHARARGRVGKGRGSGAGCLVSYLTGITGVDPVEYRLLFSRFYNDGRNAPGKISLPDIDTDFEKHKREDVIRYCRDKYGHARVAQMATFQRMQGRSALKDVLRANGSATFEEANRVCEHVPDEASIADHLQDMLEGRGESSVLLWALENEPAGLAPWCKVNEQGSLEGPLAAEFAQAIRLEGTYRSMGKHPSGVVICGRDLAEVVPMTQDRSTGDMMIALDMRDAEAVGCVKFDVLGTTVLDRVRGALEVVRTGRAGR